MSFQIGETVGQYRLLEQLGQGGMATVYKAYHPALDRQVAIKALHPAFTQEPNFIARFKREAQVVARLEHPNIVPIYDFSEHEGRPYLVMKFIEGETLKARMKRGKLHIDDVSQIVEGVGSALAYAHEQGVLHRDVKPSNVLLGSDGRIYLADFGLARMAQAGESTLSSDIIIGTPQYISPEQAKGESDLDSGTDIYSLGILLYEMTVGRVPYSADTPYSIIHDHIYTPLPLPHLQNKDITPPVERVMLKALAKERVDRFETVEAMVSSWREAVAQPLFPAQIPSMEAADNRDTTMEGSTLPVEKDLYAVLPTATGDVNEVDELIPKDVTTLSTKRRKTRRWWLYLIGALLLFCVCFFVLAVISARQENRRSISASTIPLTGEVIAEASSPSVQRSAVSLKPTLPGRTQLPALTHSEAIWAARMTVTADPGDPSAHFALAQAYLDASQISRAWDEFNLGRRFAGESSSYYIDAGNKFFDNKDWLMAALMYNLAIEFSPIDKPKELLDKLHNALYLAARDPSLMAFAREDDLFKNVDPNMQSVVRARYMLLQGESENAKEIYEGIPATNRVPYEVKLLEAEILLYAGHASTATEKLLQLELDDQAPTWIRVFARLLIDQAAK